jgi:hypothetical protein
MLAKVWPCSSWNDARRSSRRSTYRRHGRRPARIGMHTTHIPITRKMTLVCRGIVFSVFSHFFGGGLGSTGEVWPSILANIIRGVRRILFSRLVCHYYCSRASPHALPHVFLRWSGGCGSVGADQVDGEVINVMQACLRWRGAMCCMYKY